VHRTREDLVDLRATVDAAVDGLLAQWVSTAQAERVATILDGFTRFCERAHGLTGLAQVSPSLATAFIASRTQTDRLLPTRSCTSAAPRSDSSFAPHGTSARPSGIRRSTWPSPRGLSSPRDHSRMRR
jgi:hypothetical protein